uniref:Bax inhibitor-1/YccA family membrane protein n=1 Tax=Italian clover phyllody phytoplasma TaxID=1196420 RepID=UPI000551EDA3
IFFNNYQFIKWFFYYFFQETDKIDKFFLYRYYEIENKKENIIKEIKSKRKDLKEEKNEVRKNELRNEIKELNSQRNNLQKQKGKEKESEAKEHLDDVQKKIFWTLWISVVVFGILWSISFYFYIPLLKYTTFLLALLCGFIEAGLLFILNCAFLKNNFILNNLFLFLFLIPFLASFLIIIFISYLYYVDKLKISPKFRYITEIMFIIFYISGIFITSFQIFNNNDINLTSTLIMIIHLFFFCFQIVLGSFMWVLHLESLDTFVQDEFPKKYEYIIISLMFMNVFSIFLPLLILF